MSAVSERSLRAAADYGEKFGRFISADLIDEYFQTKEELVKERSKLGEPPRLCPQVFH